jgi:glutaconyl-CoA decarboxylase
MKYTLRVGSKKFEVAVGQITGSQAQVTVNDVHYEVFIENLPEAPAPAASAPAPAPPWPAPPAPAGAPAGAGAVIALIPGRILEVRVAVGERVTRGQVVAIMEAMKMENEVTATAAGVVREVRVRKDAEVATGDVLLIIG